MQIRELTANTIRLLRPMFITFVVLFSNLVTSQANADYEDGVNAAFKGDFDIAFHEFSIAAEEGLDLAQFNLAILYFTGQGVKQDLEQAFNWTLAAAEQGHVNAQFNLASLYFEGQGVSKNLTMAVEWYEFAGQGGHANAAYALAKMFQRGDAVRRNPVEAHAWASMAAYNNHADGDALIADIESDLSVTELSDARRLYAQWQIGK
ncbi:MAG TPA: sel1 repeat family protein [Porticoccaceae bacterium]|nr:sel1 repeat family protein [Gammaproteobacteria bacterium]HIL60032.1 sel1 repeat family protein [Porticoccaceae bacterium]